MKKSTKEFIQKLLERELQAEFIQDNPNPLEVEYIQDLIDASKDFAKYCGDWTSALYIERLVEQLLMEQ